MRPSPTRGKAVTPHAVLEVRTGAARLIWRFDRDGKKPVQVITRRRSPLDMNMMMSKVVEEGTGRRAHARRHQVRRQDRHHQRLSRRLVRRLHRQLTSRGVWYGNDDYSPTNRMTGGSLPAMTWRDIMAYAHQGIELKPIPGVGPGRRRDAAVAAMVEGRRPTAAGPPPVLTKRGADAGPGRAH